MRNDNQNFMHMINSFQIFPLEVNSESILFFCFLGYYGLFPCCLKMKIKIVRDSSIEIQLQETRKIVF